MHDTRLTPEEHDQIPEMMLPMPSVTRVEIIDHSPTGSGREWSKRGLKEVSMSLQDEGRTLKVFVR